MRNVMKWIVIAVVVVMLAGSAAPALAGEPIPPKNGEQYVVGILYTSLAHPFILAMQELIQPDMTGSMASVGSEEIGNLPVESMGEVLEMQAGIVRTGGDFHIRGGRAGEIAYWVDGISTTDVYDNRMGVTVENQKYTNRIEDLLVTPAQVKWLCLEPLLGPIEHLPLEGIDWVVVGGESGPGARPMEAGWVRSVRDQCISAGVPFFFKQWGGVRKSKNGNELDGRIWKELPAIGAK